MLEDLRTLLENVKQIQMRSDVMFEVQLYVGWYVLLCS